MYDFSHTYTYKTSLKAGKELGWEGGTARWHIRAGGSKTTIQQRTHPQNKHETQQTIETTT